ncbi:unannotated protein [freshwater metagenome]|uniref:Unannotated protein n=1 Tax=freshwater metagenome TaxID=449393 RepID=A0A6J7CM65_9ZZZZ|nr:MBL fold metallo-hydrolase [Actinomycetota bacterium]
MSLRGARPRPAEILLIAALVGLVLGPREPRLLPVAALPLAIIAATPAGAVGATAVLASGAGWARLRSGPPHLPEQALGHVTTLRLTLEETPRAAAGSRWRAFATVRGARILLSGRGSPPRRGAGAVFQARGLLRAPGPFERWIDARGAAAVLEVSVLASAERRGGAAGSLDAVRNRAQAAFARVRDRDAGSLLRGMVLGDDALLSLRDRELLRHAGLGHLVAASGANVALLAALVLGLCAVAGAGRRTRLALVLAVTALYVPLAGSGPSIRRAAIMGGAASLALWASRPVARRHALLLAAAATLAIEPRSAVDPGWQLSFAAVSAIGLLAGPLRSALTARGVARGVAEPVALSVAAGIGTAPVAAGIFGTVSLASLPANLMAAPLVAPATWLGMLAGLFAQIDERLAVPFATLAALPCRAVLAIGRWWGARPMAQIDAAWWMVLGAIALVVALGLALRRRPRLGRMLTALALGAVLIWPALRRTGGATPPAPGIARITFLDIGQGDATLLQAGGHALLVDAGPPGGRLSQQLVRAGVDHLDAFVGTHAQADHIGAAADVLEAMPVGLVLDGRSGVREQRGTAMAAAAHARGVRLVPGQAGQVLEAGAIRARVLWPPPGVTPHGGDPNDYAIVILAEIEGLRILLTADAESDVLSRLDLPPVDILKVSHHGSADPGLPALLARITPRIAVIEVGRGNTYGHPTPSTLRALEQSGVMVRRTDRDGAVRVEGSASSGLRVAG